MKRKIATMALVGMILASGAFGSNSLTAHAAEVNCAFDKDEAAYIQAAVFDAEYYAATYPDVVKALGTTDASAMLNHYLTFGIYEGRDASADFNADAYVSANPDLKEAYASDLIPFEKIKYFCLINHYYVLGKNENRISTIADATAAGYDVKLISDETKVIAPATASPTVYWVSNSSSSNSGSSNSGSSNSGSSNSSSSNSGSDSSSSGNSSSIDWSQMVELPVVESNNGYAAPGNVNPDGTYHETSKD